METPRVPKRVSRACDYCRKKRLKCTGQRPCLNCQLYGATCSTSDFPKSTENPGTASKGTKRKRVSTTEQAESAQNEERQESPQDPPAQELVDTQQQPHTPRAWVPTSEPEMPPIEQSGETVPDFDQYAYDLGLVIAPFWPPNPLLSLPSNGLDVTGGEVLSSITSYPTHLPTPRLSDDNHSGSVFQHLDLDQTINTVPFASTSHTEAMDLPPSQSAHELFLKKGPWDSKFVGMGSVGSTILECLRYSASTNSGSMESAVLDHLVRGIRHVDELALSRAFDIPPLPDKFFAQRGIQAYYDFIHSIYPILETNYMDEWHDLYENNDYNISAVSFSRLCLVAAIGNMVSSSRSDADTWKIAHELQEQAWSYINQVLASPFKESLQVILLHTLYLLYCAKTGIAWMTCGMAVRIAQSLGLHQQTPPQLGLGPEQISLRSRLWSVAYTLDAFLSLSEGRPSAIGASPNLGLPIRLSDLECPSDVLKSPLMFIHDWDIGLAMIANEVQVLLKNSKSLLSTLTQIADIDAQLLAWKDAIPMEYRPDQEILADDPLYCLVAMIHLKYHNLMRTIHWMSLTLSSQAKGGDFSQLGARVRSSESICVTSARSVIEVLNGMSSERIAKTPEAFIVPYCMTSISIFYRQILKEPSRPSARINLEHMRNGTLHITTLLEGIGPRRHFRALFEAMQRVAEGTVNKASNPSDTLQMERNST